MLSMYDCENFPLEENCLNKKIVTKIEFSGTFTPENISFYISELNKYENCRLFVFKSTGDRYFDVKCVDDILTKTCICAVQTSLYDSSAATPHRSFAIESWV